MVTAGQRAAPSVLPNLFSNLLYYGVFPPAWKAAK